MIQCKLCNKFFKSLTNSHLVKHGLTTREYVQRFNTPVVSLETRQRMKKQDGIAWDDLLLGQVPDSVIANQVGVYARKVCGERLKRGIPAFRGSLLTQEGHPCRSIYEAMYDAYLHWKQIEHEHEKVVTQTSYVADFYVVQDYVEIAGMLDFAKYAQKYAKKREAYEKLGLKVIWLSPDEVLHLFQNCPIGLSIRSERKCSHCGKANYDLVKGICRHPCYMKLWRSSQSKTLCQQCGKAFSRAKTNAGRFCSRACYWKSMELGLPSWGYIWKRLKKVSAAQLARELNVKPSTLYRKIDKYKKRGQEISL